MCCKYRQKIEDYLKLYLILETEMLQIPVDEFIHQVIEGGVTAIQLRDKKLSAKERYEKSIFVKRLLVNKDIMLVVNDRLDIALALGIDAIHVGVKDIPPYIIRELYPDMIVGYSCNNFADLQVAEDSKVDYIGVGPAFVTATKDDLRPVIGVDGIGKLVSSTKIPAVAIGGIKLSNCEQLASIGVKGVAVSSELCSSREPYKVAREFRKFFP